MEDRHIAYVEHRYTHTDDDGKDHFLEKEIWCGDWIPGGGKELCDTCLGKAEKLYPQGWRYYPGDICQHGTYVGGVGIDWMCHYCEQGMHTWVDDPLYELVVEADGVFHPTRLGITWRESSLRPNPEPWQLRTFARVRRLARAVAGELEWTIYAEKRESGYWTDEEAA